MCDLTTRVNLIFYYLMITRYSRQLGLMSSLLCSVPSGESYETESSHSLASLASSCLSSATPVSLSIMKISVKIVSGVKQGGIPDTIKMSEAADQ